MALTPQEIKDAFPGDATIQAMSDAALQVYIDIAECLIVDSVFCTAACGGKAQLFMVAHLVTLGSRGGGGISGAVTQESVGDISRSYANGGGISDVGTLGLTSYGQVVAALFNNLRITPFVV